MAGKLAVEKSSKLDEMFPQKNYSILAARSHFKMCTCSDAFVGQNLRYEASWTRKTQSIPNWSIFIYTGYSRKHGN